MKQALFTAQKRNIRNIQTHTEYRSKTTNAQLTQSL